MTLVKVALLPHGVTIEMAKKKRSKSKSTSSGALLKNSIYAVRGSRPKRVSKKQAQIRNAVESNAAGVDIAKGKKMAIIEAYAKEHGITITQAMIQFM